MNSLKADIADIKNTLLQMSSLVEDTVKSSIIAFKQNNIDLAQKIIDNDRIIDEFENNIDNLILKTILKYSPKDKDLIFLLSAKQISEQLERVGDHAVNISEQIISLLKSDTIGLISPGNIDMATIAVKMLGESINAFVFSDTDLALNIRETDKKVDLLYNSVINEEINIMEGNRSDVKSGVYNIILALNIERIADLATNIAEHVVFFVEGRNIKHISNEEFYLLNSKNSENLISSNINVNQETLCKKINEREPFECLYNHAKYVHLCVKQTANTIKAYFNNDIDYFNKLKEEVLDLEQTADLIKRNVRANLPSGIIMPIDKFQLFMYLSEQDNIANTTEDIVNWLSYKHITINNSTKEDINKLFQKCVIMASKFPDIIKLVNDYYKTGNDKIKQNIKDYLINLREIENEADLLENKIKEDIFKEYKDTFIIYYLIRLVENIGKTANTMISAADILRSMLAK